MNCKNAELYMDALLDDQIAVKDSIEIIEHIENCNFCKTKWTLNEEIRAKLKHFIGSIKASSALRSNVLKSIQHQQKIFRLKPALIAASLVFLLGVGMIIDSNYLTIPKLFNLHNKLYCQLVTNDIGLLSKYIEIDLKKPHLAAFEKANFKPHGATKFTSPFNKNKNVSLIALKNDKGQKVSLCFLPKDHHLKSSQETEINGIVFHHGMHQNYHFAYWKQNDNTIALISDSLTSMEMIELAMPLANEV